MGHLARRACGARAVRLFASQAPNRLGLSCVVMSELASLGGTFDVPGLLAANVVHGASTHPAHGLPPPLSSLYLRGPASQVPPDMTLPSRRQTAKAKAKAKAKVTDTAEPTPYVDGRAKRRGDCCSHSGRGVQGCAECLAYGTGGGWV